MNTASNVLLNLNPTADVILADDVTLPGVIHQIIDGHNTAALGDVARHVAGEAETRERLATIATAPATAYVESSTTAPLPGHVERGINPTSHLLDRVARWEAGEGPNDDSFTLLRDAVQVIRTVAVDTLRSAAVGVFDTAMPAEVARWLEARALLLERGHDVHDSDRMDAAIHETTLAAQRRARAAVLIVGVSRLDPDGGDIICACGNTPNSDGFYQCTEDGALLDDVGHEHATGQNLYRCNSCGRILDYDALAGAGEQGIVS